jgi:nucleotide-binding universal stress UspA family protein
MWGMKLLIGYDGSQFADAAIDDLVRAGLPDTGVQATVLTVADVWPHLPASCFQPMDDSELATASPIVRNAHRLAADAIREARETAARGAQRLAALFPGWTVSPEARGDSPAAAIVAGAEQLPAELVVISALGQSGVARPSWGSVAQKVVTHAPCTVRVGRRGWRDSGAKRDEPIRILIGIDGSEGASRAVTAAATRRHWPPGSQAKLLTALDARVTIALAFTPAPAPDAPAPGGAAGDETQAAAQRVRSSLQSVERELGNAGLAVSSVIERGDPRAILLRAAEQWKADCIFVGARGASRIQRFLLGSVAGALAARAGCSVEVVR